MTSRARRAEDGGWTPGCRVILLGMGDKVSSGTGSRNIGQGDGPLRRRRDWVDCPIHLGVVKRAHARLRRGNDAAGLRIPRAPSGRRRARLGPWSVCFQASPRHQESLADGISRIHSVVGGVHLARDLGNEPANVLYPMEYARRAVEWADGKEDLPSRSTTGTSCWSSERAA
ncbi:MAG: hypothetical protein Ct9H300mP30_1190 [Methanobacteriota archaeon]|nr:MAG: hypothetical protein Ct9H300mP30_1190 [Euryarchaeota archaeon]